MKDRLWPATFGSLARLCGATLLLSMVVACGMVGHLRPPPAPPALVGPLPVGVTTLEIDDPGRARRLTVEVWYPAAAPAPTTEPVVYGVEVAGITIARLRSATGAHRDAAPADGAPRPVALLSHGYASGRFQNVGLAELLASHGYVVAAPDHAGNTMGDMVFGISAEARARSALDRPLDLSRVLDALIAAPSARVGAVDAGRVAVIGHSYGGRAALAMVGARFDGARQQRECAAGAEGDRRCAMVPVFGPRGYRYRDPRVKAAVLLTPAGYRFYRDDGVGAADAPTLVVGAREDRTNPFGEFHRPVFEALRGRRHLLELSPAGHLTATDVCELVDSIGFFARAFGGDRARDGCGEGFMSDREALDRVGRATLAFLALYVEERPEAAFELAEALQPTVKTAAR